jgi:hypothetical protein
VGAGAEVVINGVAAPTAEKFDEVAIDFGTKEGCSASGSEGADGDFGRWDAGDGFAESGGQTQGSGELVRGERPEFAGVFAGSFVVGEERSLTIAVVLKDVVGDALKCADGTKRFVGAFVCDHVTFGRVLLVVEPEPTEVEGRVITRGSRGVDKMVVVFVEEMDVDEAKGDGFGILGLGFGVLARTEQEEVADDTHVLDSAPLVWREARLGWHVVQLGKDDGVDGPNTVGRRISSGKALEHFAEAWVERSRRDGRGAFGLVHHADDFLADGTEVFSNGPRASRLVIFVEVSPSDPDKEDLEVDRGPLDPKEMAVDGLFLTERCPMGPLRGLGFSCGFNHGFGAGCLSNADISEERVARGSWQRRQVPCVCGKCWLKWARKAVSERWKRREAASGMTLSSPGMKENSEQ